MSVILEIAIDFIITIFVYLTFPICYVLKCGKVDKKKAKKLAFRNSAVGYAIFVILSGVLSNWTMVIASGAPAVFYYLIAKAILVDKSIKNEQDGDDASYALTTDQVRKILMKFLVTNLYGNNTNTFANDNSPTTSTNLNINTNVSALQNATSTGNLAITGSAKSVSNNEVINQTEDIEHVIMCPICGYQIFDEETNCSNCGAKVVRKNQSQQTQVATSQKSNAVEKIKKMQTALAWFFVFLLLFVIIYPSAIYSAYEKKIPDKTEYATISLTELDANKTAFCVLDGDYNYLYIKDNSNKLILYRFYNSEANYWYYNATSKEIQNYFSYNLKSGMPTLSYVMPLAIPMGCVSVLVLLIVIGTIMYFIHKTAEEEIFKLAKTNDIFIKLKNDVNNEDVSQSEYVKLKKKYFSSAIMQDNSFWGFFKFLY